MMMPSNTFGDRPSTFLGGMKPSEFMRDYWHKKPLLVRGAVPGFDSPLAPEELAGLACEPDVTSRLVQEQGGDYPWQVRHGPFRTEDFTTLPATHYSLLVQEVDRLVPEVAALLEQVAFLPNWRIDDVMVSYAPTHGNVGAHVDSYDVFLLQGLGRRRWQIGGEALEDEPYVPDLDVRILQEFEPTHEWVVEPGDMLYLPPRVPHYGVALEDCMTYSIGCRAPRASELALEYLTHLSAEHAPQLYSDPDPTPVDAPGALDTATLGDVRSFVRVALEEVMDDPAAFDDWFGRHVTRPPRGQGPLPADDAFAASDVSAMLEEGAVLHRSASPHFAHRVREDGTATLYVGGEAYTLGKATAPAAPVLTGRERLTAEHIDRWRHDEEFLQLLADLLNRGYLW